MAKIHIVDNKKLLLEDDEYNSYISICRSYDRKSFKGEHMFIELFETNNDGIITKLNSPKRETSFEVVLFLVILFNAQNTRACMRAQVKKVDDFLSEQKKAFETALAEMKKS